MVVAWCVLMFLFCSRQDGVRKRQGDAPDGTPGRMAVDLGSVSLGLVEDVDHLFVAEKHLARNERSRRTVPGRRTIIALTRVLPTCTNDPAFSAATERHRLERTSHGEIVRGMREGSNYKDRLKERRVKREGEWRAPLPIFFLNECYYSKVSFH